MLQRICKCGIKIILKINLLYRIINQGNLLNKTKKCEQIVA